MCLSREGSSSFSIVSKDTSIQLVGNIADIMTLFTIWVAMPKEGVCPLVVWIKLVSRGLEWAECTRLNYILILREQKPPVDRSLLIISNQQGGTVGRLPGQLNGKQFRIKDCNSAKILILDYTNTVSVEKCVDCQILIGPTKGRYDLEVRNTTTVVTLSFVAVCICVSVSIVSLWWPVSNSGHEIAKSAPYLCSPPPNLL